MKDGLTIGMLAKSASVNVETIRYYERRGLITQPQKPLQGYRSYPAATQERLLFIKRAQELGFSLEEVANLLSLGEANCEQVQGMAEEKIHKVRAKINDLQRMEAVLDKLLSQCRNNADSSPCPIVESLLPPPAKNI